MLTLLLTQENTLTNLNYKCFRKEKLAVIFLAINKPYLRPFHRKSLKVIKINI